MNVLIGVKMLEFIFIDVSLWCFYSDVYSFEVPQGMSSQVSLYQIYKSEIIYNDSRLSSAVVSMSHYQSADLSLMPDEDSQHTAHPNRLVDKCILRETWGR